MSYIKRHLETHVLALSREYPVLLLTGPRQVGKTTMLKKLMQKEKRPRNYVTLDDLNERSLAVRDPAMFLQIHQPPVLIDEVQYAPELFTYIKILVDKKRCPGDFWLTGSQLFKLMRGVQESLAGRVALLNLFSLSQSEIAGSLAEPFTVSLSRLQNLPPTVPFTAPTIFERIWQGSMPALCSREVHSRDIYYASYLNTYLERDIQGLLNSLDALKFMRFMTAVAARTGQLLNYKGLADDADINQATVKSWLNVLETLGIIFYLHPYANNTLKRTIKAPKLYFYDLGLVCYLTRWSTPEVALSGAMSGALFENYVVSEIMKSYWHHAVTPYIYYYRDRDTKEIDLLLEEDGVLTPVEIKKTMHPEKRMTSAFTVLDSQKQFKRGTGAIICLHDKLSAIDEQTLIVPVGLI